LNEQQLLRRQWERLYDSHYKEKGHYSEPCIYCGQQATGYDHVPPLAYVAALADTDALDVPLHKYPACPECNSFLGSTLILTLKARRAYVRGKIEGKYRSFLQMPRWDEEELNELDPDFAEHIRRASKFAEHIKKRLSFYR
jgi:hypothetical protein